MLKNYVKIAFRNLIHRKTFSFINIMGLALGISSVILILLWVQDEISYDQFHNNGKNIYKVYLTAQTGNESLTVPNTYGAIAADLKSQYPEVINSTRYYKIEEARVRTGSGKQNGTDQLFIERMMVAVDPTFLTMFSFPLLKGDPKTALSNPYSILLTQNMAEKYFGNDDPVGKTITIDNKDNMVVTGLLKNIPHNTDFRFDFLVPASYIEKRGGNINTYNQTNCEIYLQLINGASYGALTQKIQTEYDKTLPPSKLMKIKHHLTPFEDVHLYGNSIVPRIVVIYVLMAMAVFILLIACINFINLSTARSILRVKEIGVKKVVGAKRSQIILQFLLESTLISAIALIVSILLLELVLPTFNLYIQNQLAINWFSMHTWLGIVAIIIITGVLAGSYPAFYISSFTPDRVFRGNTSLPKTSRARLRKILVVSQFAVTIILIINIVNTSRWDKYLNELGFDKDHVIYLQNRGPGYDVFKAKLLSDPNIISVTTASYLPLQMMNFFGSEWGSAPNQNHSPACMASVGYDFIETFKIKMVNGRFYSPAHPSDETDGVIVNEKAIKEMNLEDPVGKKIYVLGKPFTIVGIIQDFHFVPKVFEIKPLILKLSTDATNWIFVRIKTDEENHSANSLVTINRISSVFKELYPDYPFEYQYLSEYKFNEAEIFDTAGKVIVGFAIFGIVVAALGLFGLSSFMVEQRTKEIGIRKILGASKLTILNLLTSEFLKLILIANLIAWPLSYLLETAMYQMFAYKLGFNYWMFASAGIFSLLIAFAAICFQVMRAAAGNPVKALRYE